MWLQERKKENCFTAHQHMGVLYRAFHECGYNQFVIGTIKETGKNIRESIKINDYYLNSEKFSE